VEYFHNGYESYSVTKVTSWTFQGFSLYVIQGNLFVKLLYQHTLIAILTQTKLFYVLGNWWQNLMNLFNLIRMFSHDLLTPHRRLGLGWTFMLSVCLFFKLYIFMIKSNQNGQFQTKSPPCKIQNCLNCMWHWFNKVLKAFFRNVGPYWSDSILQLMEIRVRVPFHHIPKMLYWVEIWWVWRPFWYSQLIGIQETNLKWLELCDMVHYPAGSSHQRMGIWWP